MLLQVNKLDLSHIFIRPDSRKTRIHPGDNMTKRNFQWSAVCLLFPDWMQSNAIFFSCIYFKFFYKTCCCLRGWLISWGRKPKPNHATPWLAWSPPDDTELKETRGRINHRQAASPKTLHPLLSTRNLFVTT